MKEFIRGVFSDNGSPSSSRVFTGLHSVVACAALLYVVIKTHGFPDGMTLAGLGGFVGAPLGINAVRNIFDKKKDE
jgi:hypothetical protein